jgi:hypothetical protein
MIAAIIGVFALCLSALFAQVDVSDAGVTRTCGSAFDVATDRSGWELWWARDLDEPTEQVRGALPRTNLCPGAVNRQTGLVASLFGLGTLFTLLVWLSERSDRRRPAGRREVANRILRLGTATTVVGAVLTSTGLIAVIVLVADADATLFLYTDRLVVAVGGLIVLTPAVALLALGRVLSLVGAHVADLDEADGDD